MISVANRIYANPTFAQTFEARFLKHSDSNKTVQGFLFYQVLQPTQKGDPYIVFTCWESQEDFQNWVQSDAFKKSHAPGGNLPKAAFDKKNQIEIHKIIMDSRDPELTTIDPISKAKSH